MNMGAVQAAGISIFLGGLRADFTNSPPGTRSSLGLHPPWFVLWTALAPRLVASDPNNIWCALAKQIVDARVERPVSIAVSVDEIGADVLSDMPRN